MAYTAGYFYAFSFQTNLSIVGKFGIFHIDKYRFLSPVDGKYIAAALWQVDRWRR